MKKVLLVSLFDTDLFIGELARRLSKNDLEVWQYCISKGYLKNVSADKFFELDKNYKNPFSFIKNANRVKKIIGPCDTINYHFTHYSFALFDVLFNSSAKKIASIWGSDLYKATGLKRHLNWFFYKRCQVVTATNVKALSEFQRVYPKHSGNYCVNTFGLVLLDYLENQSGKNLYEDVSGKFDKTVCLGTNASPFQNHLKVIDSIANIDRAILSKQFFILPMTYPKNALYITQVKEALKKANISFLIIDEYMTLEQLADLRRATDILIQVQDTDQLSGAMQEAIYAGAEVITGEWLPYEVFSDLGVRLEKVSSLSEVGSKLTSILRKDPMPLVEFQTRSDAIYKLSSWKVATEKWVALMHERST